MPSPRTAAATAARLRNQAARAAEDPVKLARAARVVQAALEQRRLSIAEVVATLPPLTETQRERLRALLAPGVAAVAASQRETAA